MPVRQICGAVAIVCAILALAAVGGVAWLAIGLIAAGVGLIV